MNTEKKVFIQVESEEQQQENAKNSRWPLKVLQQTATDKENLAGRPRSFKDAKTSNELEEPENKRKKVPMQHKSVQMGECIITAEDLILDERSSDYWRELAETRGDALDQSIEENEIMKEGIEALQEENRICKEMLDESKTLVQILIEMLKAEDKYDMAEEESEEAA